MSDPTASTKNIWPYYAKANVDNATQKTSKTESDLLDKDDFLKILVAELKNQDPMDPMNDREYIAQLAQLSSVEQLTNMSSDIKLLRQSLGMASDLIGKSVSWEGTDSTGSTVSKEGVVEAISIKDNKQYAIVEGEQVALDQILKVWVAEQ